MLTDTNYSNSSSAELKTLTSTSTTTSTVTSWTTLQPGFAWVTISRNLPNISAATYPDPWMTATGAELSSLNMARNAGMTMSDNPPLKPTSLATTTVMPTMSPSDMPFTVTNTTSSAEQTSSVSLISTTEKPDVPLTSSLALKFTTTNTPRLSKTPPFLNTSLSSLIPTTQSSTITSFSDTAPSTSSVYPATTSADSILVGEPIQTTTTTASKHPNALSGFGTATSGIGVATPTATANVLAARHIPEHRLRLLHPHVGTSLILWLVGTIVTCLICFTLGSKVIRLTKIWVGNDREEQLISYTTKPSRAGLLKRMSFTGRSSMDEARWATGKESSGEDERLPTPHRRRRSRPWEDHV